MKQYEKPQTDISHIRIESSMLDLSVHNEEGSGIQRAKKVVSFDEDPEESFLQN